MAGRTIIAELTERSGRPRPWTLRRVAFGANLRKTLIRIAAITATATVIFSYVFLPVRAQGVSMLPTYSPDGLKLVNRLAYWRRDPARGDIVAIRLSGPGVVYLKRVVGLPRERIAIARGIVYANGVAIDEPYVKYRASWDLDEIRLDSDEYFVAGDNRGMRIEDHLLGRTHRNRIVGRVAP